MKKDKSSEGTPRDRPSIPVIISCRLPVSVTAATIAAPQVSRPQDGHLEISIHLAQPRHLPRVL